MTKDEAAELECKTQLGDEDAVHYEEECRMIKRAVNSGWTQGQKELVRLAREKALNALVAKEWGTMEPEPILKLSDLEAIKLELEK